MPTDYLLSLVWYKDKKNILIIQRYLYIMKALIKKVLNEFKVDELTRRDYRDGEIVMEYVEGHDYPRFVLYYDVQLEDKDEYEMIAEFDSRFFDAAMIETIIEYLKSRQ